MLYRGKKTRFFNKCRIESIKSGHVEIEKRNDMKELNNEKRGKCYGQVEERAK